LLLISLIIPTRERASYLRESIQTAIQIPDREIEIVISDNASTDGTSDVVGAIADPRIRYLNTGRRISMRQNFEFALENSRGDYVIFIGDDDAFVPRQFPFLRTILEQHKPDVLTWSVFTYGWPIEGFGRRPGRVRFLRNMLFGAAQPIDTRGHVAHLLACELDRLEVKPAVYHGCSSRAYLERIRGDNGVIFNSSSADIYFTYRAILGGCRALHVPHPFTLNGYSPVSTGNAHQPFAEADTRAEPARRFAAENEQDPVQDVLRHGLSVPLALFSTLERARALAGGAPAPDYVAWYGYVLRATASGDPTAHRTIRQILEDYAARSGTTEELQAALSPAAMPRLLRRKLASRLRRLPRLISFKLSAETGGANTIRTAANLIDTILDADYGRVLAAEQSPARSWYRALGRAIAYRMGSRPAAAPGAVR
jgi:hypothetical protein